MLAAREREKEDTKVGDTEGHRITGKKERKKGEGLEKKERDGKRIW